LKIEEINRIGAEIYREKYRFKTQEGFSLDDLRIPKRIFETPSPVKKFDESYIRQALAHVKKTLDRQSADT
jgi:aldehyde:ferredoxin oxidoreductase